MLSPFAAPSIIRPMIDVPQTRLPSFSTSMTASSWLARLTNLAEARACRPRWFSMRSSRLNAVKPLLPREFPTPPRYICARPRAPLSPRRGRHHLARAFQADQHRQIDPGDELRHYSCLIRLIAGRGVRTKQVGQMIVVTTVDRRCAARARRAPLPCIVGPMQKIARSPLRAGNSYIGDELGRQA